MHEGPRWSGAVGRETIPIDHDANESGLYDLVPTGEPENVPDGFVVRRDAEQLVDAIAGDLYIHAHNCVRTFGDFHIALSGGTTPQPLYRRLMYDPRYRDLPWPRTHLWITNHEARGEPVGPLITETIAVHADVPPSQTHTAFGSPEGYAAEVREHLGWREKGHDRLDYVLLGVDEKGGIAGLVGSDLSSREPVTTGHAGPTLSLGMINAARFVAIMAVGASKKAVLTERSGMLARVKPLSGELRVYADAAACPEVGPRSGTGGTS